MHFLHCLLKMMYVGLPYIDIYLSIHPPTYMYIIQLQTPPKITFPSILSHQSITGPEKSCSTISKVEYFLSWKLEVSISTRRQQVSWGWACLPYRPATRLLISTENELNTSGCHFPCEKPVNRTLHPGVDDCFLTACVLYLNHTYYS